MKNIAITLAVSCLILSGAASPARADEKNAAVAPKPAATKGSWSTWFKDLKSTLSQSAVGGERKRGRNATSVAAVRGDDQAKKNIADPNESSLKGEMKTKRVKEMMAFDTEFGLAVDLVSAGKLDEGLKKLESFKGSHPKHRVEDVDKAIEGVKAMMAESAAAPAAKE